MGADRLNEFELIARFFVPLAAGEPGAFGLSDDAAAIALEPGHRMVVTTDTIVSGVHFVESDPPESVAAKALAVNLSDLAAMGAKPRAYTLSLALPKDWSSQETILWLEGFVCRLAWDQRKSEVNLIGGDTVSSPGPMCITLTALGAVRAGAELRRSTARPGDLIFVSGSIGDAALGLKYIAGELPDLPLEFGDALVNRYRFPQARTELGQQLVGIARGVADVSDGLVADLEHICVASNVSATIEASSVPLSSAARAAIDVNPDLLAVALTGGDDYELVFAVPPASADAIQAISKTSPTSLTAIGRADKPDAKNLGTYAHVLGQNGSPLDLTIHGYQHF